MLWALCRRIRGCQATTMQMRSSSLLKPYLLQFDCILHASRLLPQMGTKRGECEGKCTSPARYPCHTRACKTISYNQTRTERHAGEAWLWHTAAFSGIVAFNCLAWQRSQ